ncbi:hypothetical protein XENOCAPTIV_022570 [Xenoophorus captivus]|uniref:G-protein coupled receptors family 1 profile domain-containing protein n=1 Tax=Xenoophorus captivus TaxID=1517983 RepID=A0ABV0RTV8_9TELE
MASSAEDYENYTYEYEEYGNVEELKVDHSQTEPIHIISVVIYIICFTLGLIGNGVVIWVTGFKSKKTVNSVWFLNLAIADFVFVLFLPFYIDYILRDFHWNFGLSMCKINSFVSVMNMYASVLFLTVLTVDRYGSLVHLNWCQRYRTVQRAWLLCGCVWQAAALLSCHALIFRDTLHFGDKVLCYMNYHMTNKHTAARTHITLVSIRITVGFLLPLTAISVTGILLLIKVRRSQGFFNSCINPLLYMLLNKKVRRILKDSCVNLTKSSLRELSQSTSTTEVENMHGVHQDSVPDEHTASSTL